MLCDDKISLQELCYWLIGIFGSGADLGQSDSKLFHFLKALETRMVATAEVDKFERTDEAMCTMAQYEIAYQELKKSGRYRPILSRTPSEPLLQPGASTMTVEELL